MSCIHGYGNQTTELELVRLFRMNHITGWRRHLKLNFRKACLMKSVSGKGPQQEHSNMEKRRSLRVVVRPDFVFPRSRIAVFVDGCFWHCCPKHSKLPCQNRIFWKKKLAKNVARDRFINRFLRDAGWQVIRIWEHDLALPTDRCVLRVRLQLNRRS